jgi:hypothetical protein
LARGRDPLHDWPHRAESGQLARQLVEGQAVQITDNDLLGRLADSWATKWDGRWHFEVRDGAFEHEGGGVALVFSVTATKIFAFAKGTFAQTRHRF